MANGYDSYSRHWAVVTFNNYSSRPQEKHTLAITPFSGIITGQFNHFCFQLRPGPCTLSPYNIL